MSIIPIIILFAFFMVIIFLQIFLSKKETKWLGLILPIIFLLFSLTAILSIPAYSKGVLTSEKTLADGTVVKSIVEQGSQPVTDTGSLAFQIISIFMLYNIPTAIFMLIYFNCRQKFKKAREIVKMNIQDL